MTTPDPFDETDAVLARKLGEIAPPADLRARLLALEKPPVAPVEAKSGAWWSRGIAAAAAVIALAFVTWSFWPRSGDSLGAATADLSTFLTSDFQLAMATSDVAQVRAWLARKNPGRPVDLPALLAANRPLGCRDLQWRDHRGSLACFSIGDDREAHLAMFPAGTFADDPGATPKIASAGKWTRAAWTRDGMTYLLFVPAGMDPMKLLAGAPQRVGKIASSHWRSNAWGAANSPSVRARIVLPV